MIRLRPATPAELAQWDALVRGFANHRVVHLRAWIEFLAAAGCGRPLYLVAERDGQLVAAVPGLLTRLGGFTLYGSPLPGWQTVSLGPAFDPARVAAADLCRSLITLLERVHGVVHVELVSSDLDGAAMTALGFEGEMVPTYRLALHPDDEARNFRELKDSARRNVKRAIKLGLTVRIEHDEAFVDEHYTQLKEVYVRGGNVITFDKDRVLQCFRYLRDAGRLIAASVLLPDGETRIASGMFFIEGRELLLWTWAHRTTARWYRPTELMTWTVMQQALAAGCDTFDFMGLGEFKAKFGAELDTTKWRWRRSRYRWLSVARRFAERGYRWQQAVRGRVARFVTARGDGDGSPTPNGGGAR
jgi:CelD/BcsL family acetyltransferase involved in cellulose biosynthesis